MTRLITSDIYFYNQELKLVNHVTNDQINILIDQKVNELNQYGHLNNCRILLVSKNDQNFLMSLLALMKIGASVILMSPETSDFELSNVINRFKPKLLIKNTKIEIFDNGLKGFTQEANIVFLTSGTTGDPKGVCFTFKELVEKAQVIAENFKKEELKNSLIFLPMSFGHGLIANTLLPLFLSQTLHVFEKINVPLINNLNSILEDLQISYFSSVPSFWRLVIEYSDEKKLNAKKLKRVHCASSYLSEQQAREILDFLPDETRFFNCYGLTEMAAWVGWNEVRLNRDNVNQFSFFRNVEAKTINGILFLKSPIMFNGYVKDGNFIQSVFNEEGYFETGDLFEKNKLVGRKNDVVNKAGQKIYFYEIEELVYVSGLVKECCAFKYLENEEEYLGLAIVLNENQTIQKIKEYLLSKLPTFKMPNKILTLNAIIKTERGKIDRKQFE